MKVIISYKQLPCRIPFGQTLLGWLALDHWGAPPWAYGVGATLAVLGITAAIILCCLEDQVELSELR